jgi:hypothetical protein
MRIRSIIIAGLALLAIASPAKAVDPQTFIDHSSNWIEQEAGIPVDHPRVQIYDTLEESKAAWTGDGDVPAGSSGSSGVAFYDWVAPEVRGLAEKYGKVRGALNYREIDAASTIVHELLHRVGMKDYYNDDRREKIVLGHSMSYWEEAATEAVTMDLLPKYTAQLFGDKLSQGEIEEINITSVYRERMVIIRQMSRFATGSPNYKHPRAYHWRSDFLVASYPERAKMLKDAYQIRVAWVKGRPLPNPAPKLLPLR